MYTAEAKDTIINWITFNCSVCKEEVQYTGVGEGTHHFFATHYYMHQLESMDTLNTTQTLPPIVVKGKED